MRFRNRPLVAVTTSVAAVAVLAAAAGAVMAGRQGPEEGGDAAAPLTGGTSATLPGSPTPGSSPAPSPASPTAAPPLTPPARPTTPPTTTTTTKPSGLSGPAVVELSPSKVASLSRGRGPQLTYLSGREVRGGVGRPVTIPGTADIRMVGRIVGGSGITLAVVGNGAEEELLRIRGTAGSPQVTRVAGVSSLVVSPDGSSAAYATTRRTADGTAGTGSTVYAQTGSGEPRQLVVATGSDVRVLAHAGGKVYFTSPVGSGNDDLRLYAWTPGRTAAARVGTVLNPSALTPDGRLVAWRDNSSIDGSCSTVSEVASRKRLWRTCEYEISRFTAGGSVAIGRSTRTTGSGSDVIAAIDAATGNVLREWKGVSFTRSAAEDDDHLLLRVDDGIDTPAAIIRCTISTGRCELATPLGRGQLTLGS